MTCNMRQIRSIYGVLILDVQGKSKIISDMTFRDWIWNWNWYLLIYFCFNEIQILISYHGILFSLTTEREYNRIHQSICGNKASSIMYYFTMRVFCCVRGRYQDGNFNSSFIDRVHPLILKLLDCVTRQRIPRKTSHVCAFQIWFKFVQHNEWKRRSRNIILKNFNLRYIII